MQKITNFMKRNYKYLILIILGVFIFWSFDSKSPFSHKKIDDNPEKDKLLIELITFVIERSHFNPKEIDDSFSEHVFTNFINELDPQKRYFYNSDIEEFERYKYKLDDQIRARDITFFNKVFERFQKRVAESQKRYPNLLENPFDFSKQEAINVDYKSQPYVDSKKEMYEKWRKQLKLSAILEFDARLGKNKNATEKKSKSEIEIAARKEVLNRLNDYYELINELDRDDWFSIYINTIVQEFDPHTFYFAPEDKDRFDTRISGKFEGIGARLQKKDGQINVVEVISGGPAWRDNLIAVGDIILEVTQEDQTESVAISGMRISDAVKLIKGPKGTKVTLTIKRVDGSIEPVTITRDVVELEEAYARSALISKDNKKFGLISLPQFYIDFEKPHQVNASLDVKREIERLKKQDIQGLILDLRDNGGGSLATVVDMAGLFIKEGPIVQIKSTDRGREVLKDTDRSISWEGPLVILVNELSASASEILAAAMQDYKRAIVIGSKQTYGKGTVQNILDLNRFIRNNTKGNIGALKVTTQKFYRVNGSSTQQEGVSSDIVMVDRYSYIGVGEKDQNNSLPWDKISPTKIQAWDNYIDYDSTIVKSKQRMEQNKYIQLIDENARWLKKQRDDQSYTLNHSEYKKEIARDSAYLERFRPLGEYKNALIFKSLPYEQMLFKKDTILKEKRSRWHTALETDVYIEEGVNVLEDLQSNFNKIATAQK